MIDSGNTMSTITIVDRIIKNAMQFTLRNINKEKKEMDLLSMQTAKPNSDKNNNVNDGETTTTQNWENCHMSKSSCISKL